MKAKIVNQICGISKTYFKIISQKKQYWGGFFKVKKKIYSIGILSSTSPLSAYVWFYRKATPEMLAIYKVLANCKDIPRFLYLSKSALVKWCVNLRFWYKHQSKKLYEFRICCIVAQRHNYCKKSKASDHRGMWDFLPEWHLMQSWM